MGENGAFYFRYDPESRRMLRRYWRTAAEREADRLRMDAIRQQVLAEVPGCAVAADQSHKGHVRELAGSACDAEHFCLL